MNVLKAHLVLNILGQCFSFILAGLFAVFSRSVVSNSLRPHKLQPTRLLCPGILQVAYWCGLPCPLPGDPPNPGIEPRLNWPYLTLLKVFFLKNSFIRQVLKDFKN